MTLKFCKNFGVRASHFNFCVFELVTINLTLYLMKTKMTSYMNKFVMALKPKKVIPGEQHYKVSE